MIRMIPSPENPQNPRNARTRMILLIVAAVVVVLLACGQCAFDIGVTYNIGKYGNCIYPPHSCQQP